jgi:hypothetical protein
MKKHTHICAQGCHCHGNSSTQIAYLQCWCSAAAASVDAILALVLPCCVLNHADTYCLANPANSIFPTGSGVLLNQNAWQLRCRATKKGESCTAPACAYGIGNLTAVCGSDGKWKSGSGSCSVTTCDKALSPAFAGPNSNLAAWQAACGKTPVGETCSTTAACASGATLSATCGLVPYGASLLNAWMSPTGSCSDGE